MTYEYAGIDGCPDGWFCVQLGRNDEWHYSIQPDAQAIGKIAESAVSALIDIPIGLFDSSRDERVCDMEARRLLGSPRSSSVFPAPARPTLRANGYSDAARINRQYTGRGLSMQSWAIAPKIRAIDDLILSQAALRGVLRECHPELCFWALNGKKSLAHNKKATEGRSERLKLLGRFFSPTNSLFEKAARSYLRRQVALDDIVDALVAAVTAKLGYGNYLTVPERPGRDTQDLPMEMVCWSPEGENRPM
jgi:predicted RNase H-like nuclease